MKEADILDEGEQALRTCLADVPFLRLTHAQRDVRTGQTRVDLLVKLDTPEGEQVLICEAKDSGQPRTVREATDQLLATMRFLPNAYGVVIAPYISPRSAEICSKRGIGYVDLAGNCRLLFGQIYIRKEGMPNRFAEKRVLRSLYSPKASRVLRVLLNQPATIWRVEALAREATVSLGQTFNVKKLLADREWIRVSPKGFVLAEPAALLQEWSSNYTLRRSPKLDLFSLRSVAEIESLLADVCARENIKYAFTGFSAAERLAPFTRYQRVTSYIDADERAISRLVPMLDLRRVPSGANVTLWIPRDQGVFYGLRDFDGTRTVSPVQAYLDLRALGGRGEDASDFLLDTVLRPEW